MTTDMERFDHLLEREDIPLDAGVVISELIGTLKGCAVNRKRNLEIANVALGQRDDERAKVAELRTEYRALLRRQEEVEHELAALKRRLDNFDLDDFNAHVDREVLEALEDAAERNGSYTVDPELLRKIRRAAEEHLRARRAGA